MTARIRRLGAALLAGVALAGPLMVGLPAAGDSDRERQEHGAHQQQFVHGAPQTPSL